MKRIFRIFLLSAVLAGIACVALLTFDSTILNTYLLNEVTESASTNSVRISGEELSLFFIGAKVTTLRLTLARIFLPLVANNVSLDCTSVSLLWARPDCSIHGSLYEGNIEGDLTVKPSGAEIHHAALRGMQIVRHPQIMALGISGGIVDIKTEGFSVEPAGVRNSSTSVVVKNLSITHPISISSRLTGLPLPIVIPAVTIESASALIEGNSRIKNIEGTSSFGNISGSLDLAGPGSLNLTLSISQKGMAELKPYLQFICSENILNNSSSILFSGTFRSPRCSSLST